MADTLLQGTLQGISSSAPASAIPPLPSGMTIPKETGNVEADIKTLGAAQADPNGLVNFQNVMQMTSQQAYKDRQKKEMEIQSGLFDPSRVSGNTFSSIIGNIEQKRGGDVSKVYAATMNMYMSAQEKIENRKQFLEQLQEQKRQFEAEMKLEKEKLKLTKEQDKNKYKMDLKTFNETVRQWEAEFSLAQYKAQKDIDSNESGDSDMDESHTAWSASGAPMSSNINQATNESIARIKSYIGL